MKTNIITLTDSYKLSHWKIYPEHTQNIFSYFEARVGARWKSTVFFGLQYILKEYLAGNVITKEKISQAKELVDAHMGPGIFNETGWNRLLEKHGGKLPVRIKAVPEGSVIPINNVLMTIENTDEEFAWLTNYLETLLVEVWAPSTVCTNSYEQKKIINKYLQETGDPSGLDFKLHDFSFRGDSSVETAGLCGAGHLVNFKGTDTVVALEVARDYYNAGICGFSIPATEHSQMTILGRDGESKMMRRVLTQFPNGLVACVSDSYDIYNACKNLWGQELREQVLSREGCLVIRPDSGKAEEILPDLLSSLGQSFGQTKNEKGYFVLNPKVRLIQGDHVSIETLTLYLESIKKAGYSADNIAFGSGGALVQKVDRDVQCCAFKCSAAKIDGVWRDVMKAPITDGLKKSKGGRLTLIEKDGEYKTVDIQSLGTGTSFFGWNDVLQTVFEDGEMKKEYTFEEVRENAKI